MKSLIILSFMFISSIVLGAQLQISPQVVLNYPARYDSNSSVVKKKVEVKDQKQCMIYNIEEISKMDLSKSIGAKGTFYTIAQLGKKIIFNVTPKLKKVSISIDEHIIIDVPDLYSRWCYDEDQKHLPLQIQRALKKEFDTKIFESVKVLANPLNPSEFYSSWECMGTNFMNLVLNAGNNLDLSSFKYNEVKDIIYFNNGSIVENPELIKKLREYFYNQKEKGNTDHLIANGKYNPEVAQYDDGSIYEYLLKRNKEGLEVFVYERLIEKEILDSQPNVEIENTDDDQPELKQGERFEVVNGEKIILQSNEAVIEENGKQVIVELKHYEIVVNNEIRQYGTISPEDLEGYNESFYDQIDQDGIDKNYVLSTLRGERDDTSLLESYFSEGKLDEELYSKLKEHHQVMREIDSQLRQEYLDNDDL